MIHQKSIQQAAEENAKEPADLVVTMEYFGAPSWEIVARLCSLFPGGSGNTPQEYVDSWEKEQEKKWEEKQEKLVEQHSICSRSV